MQGLRRTQLDRDPIAQFRCWMDDAVDAGVPRPDAMSVSTVDADGRPSCRMVLLKSVDERGFVFSTNYGSRKAREIASNPQVALLTYWIALERQVRVEGPATRISARGSDAIFHRRPRGARLGAWASPQSDAIDNRESLDRRVAEIQERFASDVPRPPHWGGYRVFPERIEFWQGHDDRLHDRLCYHRAEGGGWTIERLAP